MKAKINPRSLREEADYIPKTLDELADLKARLHAADLTASVVYGLCAWLTDKATGRPDTTSPTTRASYRRVLRELAEHPSPGTGEYLQLALSA